MVVRSVRVLCLAMAAWAVLFAPGAAGADVSASGVERQADRVAAAVVAPTFEADGAALSSRGCRRDADAAWTCCDLAMSALPVGSGVPAAAAVGGEDAGLDGDRLVLGRWAVRWTPLRAPPTLH